MSRAPVRIAALAGATSALVSLVAGPVPGWIAGATVAASALLPDAVLRTAGRVPGWLLVGLTALLVGDGTLPAEEAAGVALAAAALLRR